jgi:hypothetical protein
MGACTASWAETQGIRDAGMRTSGETSAGGFGLGEMVSDIITHAVLPMAKHTAVVSRDEEEGESVRDVVCVWCV